VGEGFTLLGGGGRLKGDEKRGDCCVFKLGWKKSRKEMKHLFIKETTCIMEEKGEKAGIHEFAIAGKGGKQREQILVTTYELAFYPEG